MRITEEYTNLPVYLIEIKSANYISDFAIRVLFNDGLNRRVDFKPFLESSLHPFIRKYLDETLFIQFRNIDDNLNWNDYDMIFPIGDLHEGKI